MLPPDRVCHPVPFTPYEASINASALVRFYVIMDVPNSPTINVKRLRESKKLTLRKVATALDVAESTVSRWEAGTVKPHLPLEKVQIMLELFECDFPTLYTAFRQTALETQATVDRSKSKEKSLAAA